MLLIISDLPKSRFGGHSISPFTLAVYGAITLAFSLLGRLLRGVTGSGAVAGGLVCFGLLLGAGYGGFAALVVVFLLTWAATRTGYARKQRLGSAESKAGRDAGQVFANLGIAAISGLGHAFAWNDWRLLVAASAALSEAAADTVSSEIGKAFGGAPRLITNWKPVAAGTDGGVTLLGTTAGAIAALLIAATCLAAGMLDWRAAFVAAGAGVMGMVADSVLGATVERRGVLGNNGVNFLSTGIAALIAFVAAQ